jgi:two-component system LytT family sensor kinase
VVGVINIFFYILCYKFLVPYFFKNKRYLFLIVIAISLVFTSYYIRLNIERSFVPFLKQNQNKDFAISTFKIIALLPQALIILLACLIGTFKEIFKKELIYNKTKLEESQRELELIKAKVNPHFLLNTLNNIYSVNYDESPKTSKAILQLSKVLSFTIYKNKNAQILLTEEIDLMESLIGLYQLKYDNQLNINFIQNFNDEREVKIPSLVLFSLLENAFKHSDLSLDEKSFLKIELILEKNQLLFNIENSFSSSRVNDNYLSGGIDSRSIEKLLIAQFDSRYLFKQESLDSKFSVKLMIDGI